MSADVSVEATGETVGEAKWKALRELERLAPGLDKASVAFQVVSEGERGLLGVGYTPARVVATAPAAAAPTRDPEPPREDESELEHRVRELVERVVGALGIEARVDASQQGEELLVTCTGDDLGLLIGRHGQTIDSLQYLANSILHREGSPASVTIDAAGYRARRRQALEGIALRAAERVAAGERVALEPMTAIERKVVHERLKDVEGVATLSEGTEPNRHIVVFPA
ncbi:MAG: RNA-binding cell elongation regulator Jag/EloR [Gaiellaceae bacterium]